MIYIYINIQEVVEIKKGNVKMFQTKSRYNVKFKLT